MDQRYAITVKFVVAADTPEDAEELIETMCEKAASGVSEGDVTYEGIEDIEEEED